MRLQQATAAAAFAFAVVTAPQLAQADKRIFIVSDRGDAAAVERCLTAGGASCTETASAYCKTKSYATASSFRKLDPDEITGSIPTGGLRCTDGRCEGYLAVECRR